MRIREQEVRWPIDLDSSNFPLWKVGGESSALGGESAPLLSVLSNVRLKYSTSDSFIHFKTIPAVFRGKAGSHHGRVGGLSKSHIERRTTSHPRAHTPGLQVFGPTQAQGSTVLTTAGDFVHVVHVSFGFIT